MSIDRAHPPPRSPSWPVSAWKTRTCPRLPTEFNAILGLHPSSCRNSTSTDVEPMVSVEPMPPEAPRRDVVTGRRPAGPCAVQRARRPRGVFSRAQGGGVTMSELTNLTIAEARDALRRGEVTSVELTEACLAAIDSADALGAFVHKDARDRDRARAGGGRADQGGRRARNPPWCGIPVGIKDLFLHRGRGRSQAALQDPRGLPPRIRIHRSRASCATRAR